MRVAVVKPINTRQLPIPCVIDLGVNEQFAFNVWEKFVELNNLSETHTWQSGKLLKHRVLGEQFIFLHANSRVTECHYVTRHEWPLIKLTELI